jgi:hypothetical protein
MTYCSSKPQALLFNHSQLQNLTLKNLALYPSNFTTTAPSDTIIYWGNVNLQESGSIGERVWQFQGSGITNQNSTTITFIIKTRYNIVFEGPLSGWLTTSSNANPINAYDAIEVSYASQQDETIFFINIRQDQPLQTFSYSVSQKDSGNNNCNNAQRLLCAVI